MSSQSRYGLLAVCGSLLSFSSIALALRLYARKKQRVPYMMDDVLAVAGLVSSHNIQTYHLQINANVANDALNIERSLIPQPRWSFL